MIAEEEPDDGKAASQYNHMAGDNAAILPAIRSGSAEMFNRICLDYHDPLWRFSYSIIRSSELAQDVVQDVFLDLWERRLSVNIPTSLAAYLFSAVRRRSLMYLRNTRVADRITKGFHPDDVPGHGQITGSPLTTVELGDMKERIDKAISQLSPVRQQIITMRWIEQMEYLEIAEVMEMSQEAVRAHVSRGYRTLKELLQSLGVIPIE